MTKNRAIFRERNINQISTNSTTEYPPSDCVDGETDDGMGNCYCEEGTRAKSGGRGCENICGESQTYGANGCQCDNENEIINEEGKCVKGDKQKDCEDSGGSFDNGNCSCPTDQIWDEQVNKCVIGEDVNVRDCRSGKVKNIFGECECEFGTEDDGMGGCSYPKTAQEECEDAGNVWNASTQTCMDSNSQQQDCENSGGNWNYASQTCDQNCPEGYELNAYGQCVQIEVSCSEGYIKDANGNCVIDPITECENNGGEWVPNSQIQTNATGARMATNAMSGTCVPKKEQECIECKKSVIKAYKSKKTAAMTVLIGAIFGCSKLGSSAFVYIEALLAPLNGVPPYGPIIAGIVAALGSFGVSALCATECLAVYEAAMADNEASKNVNLIGCGSCVFNGE